MLLMWTKVAKEKGEKIFWVKQVGIVNPQSALANHIWINDPPAESHLFAFKYKDSMRPMMRSIFLTRINKIVTENKQPKCHRYDFLVRLSERTYLFSNFLNFILHLGLITTPHVFYVHMTYVYSSFLMFHSSHDYMAKRSHYRIMIFSTSEYYRSMDASPPSFSSISSTTPPPLYSPSMSITDGPTWRRIPPGREVWSSGNSRL